MKTVTRSHLCVITVAALEKLHQEAHADSVEFEMMSIDPERVISVKREAFGTIEDKAIWTRLAVTERTDIP